MQDKNDLDLDDQEKEVITDSVDAPKEELIPAHKLEKALADIQKIKTRNSELENRIKSNDMKQMQDNDEWQKIAKLKEEEANDWQQKYNGLSQAFVDNKKLEAITSEARNQGIRKEAIPDLDQDAILSSLAVETTSSGRVNILGADRVVMGLKASKPHWFGSRTTNLNIDNPKVIEGDSSTVTVEDVQKAERLYKKTGSAEDKRNYETIFWKYRNKK